MSAHDALVTEYIERMSGDILEDRYRPQLAELIRGHSGIYALYKDDTLYYVGLAVDLMRRVNQHLKDRHRGAWNRFSVYLTTRDEHLKPLESLLLRVFQPKGNQQGGKLPGASDRKRTLAQAMKRRDEGLRAIALGRPMKQAKPLAKPQQSKPRHSGGLDSLSLPCTLQGKYKDTTYRATLLRDGTLLMNKTRYASLSAAAVAIVGRNVNGWWFWHYKNADGAWGRLTDLRN